jgi:Arc/MetJ-type ribon-helix-helix transcriptional regulator
MQRITITIEDDLLAEIDAAAEARGYQNRSEIIRDLARAGLQQTAQDTAQTGPSPASSMSTTMRRAISQNAWSRNSTAITNSRSPRCTSISTTTTAWS